MSLKKEWKLNINQESDVTESKLKTVNSKGLVNFPGED